MINGRCPICSKPYAIDAIDDLKSFPFCSERCRLIDVGRWANARYAIPDDPAKERSEPNETASLPDDDAE